MKKILIPLAAVAFLTACPPKDNCSDSDTAGCDTDTGGGDTDTVDTDTGTQPFTISYNWDPTQLTVTLNNATGATGFFLGIADTAAGNAGWYDEACVLGTDCHEFTGAEGVLDSVNAPADVVLGSTTLFDNDQVAPGDVFSSTGEDIVTYFVQVSGGEQDGKCFVWGDDPTYYAGTPPCETIVPE